MKLGIRWRLSLLVMLAINLWSGAGYGDISSILKSGSSVVDPSGYSNGCDERCHRWLTEDLSRVATVDLNSPSSGATRRIRYTASWSRAEVCPAGRLDIARKSVGNQSGAFMSRLLADGFCPIVEFDGVAPDSPYLKSNTWNDIVFDGERARLLTRSEFERQVIPVVRAALNSQEPSRWLIFSLFVNVNAAAYADLMATDIAALLADASPSARQETGDAGSSKASNIARVASAVTKNDIVIEVLLGKLDANPALMSSPGYRHLIDELAGVTSSMPTWGSKPVCDNPDRIARHLPWRRDTNADVTFLATLSRCSDGTLPFIRKSLIDPRSDVVATALRVWSADAQSHRSMARQLAGDVQSLVTLGRIPSATASPVWRYTENVARIIRASVPIEDVAIGLAAIDLLPGTVANLEAAGQPDRARDLIEAWRQGSTKMAR